MTRRALALLVLLSACTAVRSPTPATMPARALPGRDDVTTDDPIVEVILVHRSGRQDILPVDLLVAPSPSATSTATDTPTATVTVTPIPTNTPRPTLTPSPTELERSPTPEDFNTPSPTPRPTSTVTPTPTPPLGACVLVVTADPALNVRATPGGTRLGAVLKGDMLSPDGYALLNGVRWWRFYWTPGVSGWVTNAWVTVKAGTDCSGVPDVTARNLLGFHLIVGANDSFIALGGAKVGGAKGTTHTQPLLNELKAVNPSAVTIYRSLHNANGMIDGPLPFEWFNPDVYYAKLKPYLEGSYDFVEYVNEWAIPKLPDGSDDWPQWERFTIRMLERFTADGQCALFGSFGPGAPDIPGWPYVVNVMRWIDDHPCQPGRYHGWATHTTLPMPAWVNVNPDSYIRNPWIIERDLIFRDWALANTGYDLAKFKGGVYVTEGGWSDYSVIFDRDFTCEEVAAGWQMTKADYAARRPWVRLVSLWTLTRDGDPSWFNLQPCLPLLFR